jgi:hypothetical protein
VINVDTEKKFYNLDTRNMTKELKTLETERDEMMVRISLPGWAQWPLFENGVEGLLWSQK